MREFVIGENDAGQRLDRFLRKACPSLPASLVQKGIRTKNIKVNGRRTEQSARLSSGDVVRLFLPEDAFVPPAGDDCWREIAVPRIQVLYEDCDLLLIDKPKGMLTQPDSREFKNTVSSHLKAYLYQKGQWDPGRENAFAPALCNRIDRNTRGMVIAAKNAQALRVLNEKIRAHELTKSYLCVVHGQMTPPAGTLTGYLLKDARNNLVTVHPAPRPGALFARTGYRTLEARGRLSLVECELFTGRTHQIRAQFAACGHPLLGDGKYGRLRDNRPYGVTSQVLYSYKLRFDLPTDAGPLNRLRGRTFSLPTDQFLEDFHRFAGKCAEL